MKKTLALYFTLALVSVAFGVWLRLKMSVPFTGFKGEYSCAGIGLPTAGHKVIDFRPVEENKVDVDSLAAGERKKIGRLYLKSPSLGVMEFESEIVHSSSSAINPLAEHFFEGKGAAVELIGREGEKELYRFRCSR